MAQDTLDILALSGSQRAASWSTALLLAARALAPAGVTVRIFEAHKDWPLFNPDREGDPPQSVLALRELVSAADALLVASPEYAHGVTGTIKNTLDWLVSHPGFFNKPVAVFNPSPRALHADAALKETLLTMSAELVADACLRIPVTGSGVERADIAATPALAEPVRHALASLQAHVAARRREGAA